MDPAFGRRSVVARIGTGENPTRSDEAGAGAARRGGSSFEPAEEKYAPVGPIGAGGMGEVILVHDRDLRRDVAMKVLRSRFAAQPAMERRFVAEAQATSQLEHPGIPPVHDLGIAADGRVYFTMKVVRGRTLSEVLRDLFLGRRETRAEYTVHKLMTVLERICEAVHFAHEKGVVHRDLKPGNVMLGEFGEVHVMDWGLAKIALAPEGTAEGDDAGIQTVDAHPASDTRIGTVKGTIPYMSPEQALGRPLDRRSDVYALGAILYEMLTLMPAYDGDGPELMQRVMLNDHPRVESRNPRREVDVPLADLCRRAMATDARDRPQTALAFATELRSWLDGRAERERRHVQAEELAARGRESMSLYVASRDAIHGAERAAEEAGALFEPWQTFEEKEPLHEARLRVAALRAEAAAAFADTTDHFVGALHAEPEHEGARAALAGLWRGRLDEAERRGRRDEAAFALRMIRRYDDGRLAAYVGGDGSLELSSDPPGARVALCRYEDRRGLLAPGPERDLGTTPLAPVSLPMGSWLAILRHPDFPEVRYPVHVTRNRAWKGRVKLRTADEVGEGFVLVPGGPFAFGEGHEAQVVTLPDFAISKSPVTFGDWGEFLAAAEAEHGPEAARKFVPSVRGDGDYMARSEDGRWVALPVVCEGPARERCLREYGPGFERLLPVTGVSWDDAVAWCAWKAAATGREWRLPTEEEREKAARGVDGRRFPWGDAEDATLAKCRDSSEEPAQPEPAGAFPAAVSVYGMLDAAGNSFDLTDSWFDARRSARVVRGGSWISTPSSLRCADRGQLVPWIRVTSIGLRAARSLGG